MKAEAIEWSYSYRSPCSSMMPLLPSVMPVPLLLMYKR
jgi:hypothetical protein